MTAQRWKSQDDNKGYCTFVLAWRYWLI